SWPTNPCLMVSVDPSLKCSCILTIGLSTVVALNILSLLPLPDLYRQCAAAKLKGALAAGHIHVQSAALYRSAPILTDKRLVKIGDVHLRPQRKMGRASNGPALLYPSSTGGNAVGGMIGSFSRLTRVQGVRCDDVTFFSRLFMLNIHPDSVFRDNNFRLYAYFFLACVHDHFLQFV